MDTELLNAHQFVFATTVVNQGNRIKLFIQKRMNRNLNQFLKLRHVSSACPNEAVCHNCKGTGHRAAECPTDTVCRNCSKIGHVAAQCPSLVPSGPSKTYYCIFIMIIFSSIINFIIILKYFIKILPFQVF